MTEFQELIKDAPKFDLMERGELVAYAYAMYAAGAKTEAENTKLRELLLDMWNDAMQFDGFWDYVNDDGEIYNEYELPHYQERMRELGIEVE